MPTRNVTGSLSLVNSIPLSDITVHIYPTEVRVDTVSNITYPKHKISVTTNSLGAFTVSLFSDDTVPPEYTLVFCNQALLTFNLPYGTGTDIDISDLF